MNMIFVLPKTTRMVSCFNNCFDYLGYWRINHHPPLGTIFINHESLLQQLGCVFGLGNSSCSALMGYSLGCTRFQKKERTLDLRGGPVIFITSLSTGSPINTAPGDLYVIPRIE